MKQNNRVVGTVGEEIAAKHLTEKGYKIIERNHRTKFGEIDLIAVYKNLLIFVEVKLKVGDQFGAPEEMINPRKVYQVKKTAQMYTLKNPDIAAKFPTFRIDAVCIVLNNDKSIGRITHYENIGFTS